MNSATDEETARTPTTARDGALSASRLLHPRRKAWAIAWVVVLLTIATVVVDRTQPYGVDLGHPLGQRHSARSGSRDNGAATSTASVTRRSLSAQTSVAGTLGYAGSYTVLGQAHGTVTWLPAVGQVIRQGQKLYEVDGSPVVLLYGTRPVYRSLAAGRYASDVTGKDVRQLNRALVSLGYASRDDLDPASAEFGWATKAAVKKLQEHLGLAQTGKLELGQLVFLPTAARVTEVPTTLGGQVGGPVLKATSTRQQVNLNLQAAQQSEVKDGDRVTIALPDGTTTSGRVTSVGNVATKSGSGSDSSPTVPVAITLASASAAGSLDQAPVQARITTDTVKNALVVPVTALLALAGGGYAVETIGGDDERSLVPVTPGMFDNSAGMVQVTDTDLAVGQRVVVPAP